MGKTRNTGNLPNIVQVDQNYNVTLPAGLTVSGLSGTGVRMVVADASGIFSTQTIPSGGGGGATINALGDVQDVNLTLLANKDILYRDTTTNLWKNGSISLVLPNAFKSAYDPDIIGSRNSNNTVFTLSENFVSGTTRVFLNGLRLTKGATYDYTETAPNQITFNYAPDAGDLIVIDYIKL